MQLTQEDRDERGRIMLEAQRRATERSAPPAPSAAPPTAA